MKFFYSLTDIFSVNYDLLSLSALTVRSLSHIKVSKFPNFICGNNFVGYQFKQYNHLEKEKIINEVVKLFMQFND